MVCSQDTPWTSLKAISSTKLADHSAGHQAQTRPLLFRETQIYIFIFERELAKAREMQSALSSNIEDSTLTEWVPDNRDGVQVVRIANFPTLYKKTSDIGSPFQYQWHYQGSNDIWYITKNPAGEVLMRQLKSSMIQLGPFASRPEYL